MSRKHETCRRGHTRTPENVYQYQRKDGTSRIMCRLCNGIKDKDAAPKAPLKQYFTPNAWSADLETARVQMPGGEEVIIGAEDLARIISYGRWCLTSGYALCMAQKTLLHRLIMDAPSGSVVDHINRNPLDCRKANLRITTHAKNSQNSTITGRKNGSGHKNVCWVEAYKRWRVYLNHEGKQHYGGHYKDFDEACRAASAMRQRFHTHCPENSLP